MNEFSYQYSEKVYNKNILNSHVTHEIHKICQVHLNQNHIAQYCTWNVNQYSMLLMHLNIALQRS